MERLCCQCLCNLSCLSKWESALEDSLSALGSSVVSRLDTPGGGCWAGKQPGKAAEDAALRLTLLNASHPCGTRNVLGNDPKTNLRMSFRDVFCQSWKRQVGRDKERQILALELDSGRRKESAEKGKLELIYCESPYIDRFHSPGGKKIIKQI